MNSTLTEPVVSTQAPSKCEHTPGPWRVYVEDTDPGTPFIKDVVVVADIDAMGDDAAILIASANYHAPSLAKANARLIAAAPDMLATLYRIAQGGNLVTIEWPNSSPMPREAMCEIARAAITKATGGAA